MTLLLRGVDDRFTFSADASGERLHRRGARIEAGAAPLRETLAAGLLALAGWRPGTALVDPMCGAGTIVIEAAMQALGRAPGAERAFAMERWPLAADAGDRRGDGRAARRGAGRRVRPRATPRRPIIGSDRDPRMIESARRNAERAGVAARVTLACRDADAARPPAPTGLVITNPPYGHRLGDPRAAARGYRDLGGVLRAHFRGWRAAVVTPPGSKSSAHGHARARRDSRCATGASPSSCMSSTRLTPARVVDHARAALEPEPRRRRLEQRSDRVRVGPLPAPAHAEARIVKLAAARLADAVKHPIRHQRQRGAQPLLEHLLHRSGQPHAARSPPVLRPRRARRPGSSECPDR